MSCPLCKQVTPGQIILDEEFLYREPDKYESYMGINEIVRSWCRCWNCGVRYQTRNYPIEKLEGIYKKGYRDKEFRGESIEEAFDRISQNSSENENRFLWFGYNTKYEDTKNVLDIGSGLGIWPDILKTAGYNVSCVEENEKSVDFIFKRLNITCHNSVYPKKEFDVISLIHVLEHIERPDEFLKTTRQYLRKDGYLFVEVPDAIEFEYLPPDHDEFNSCHVVFYDVINLCKVLERNGFSVKHLTRKYYQERKLSRILILATN